MSFLYDECSLCELKKEYRHIKEDTPLNTRLMYFDLMQLAKDNK